MDSLRGRATPTQTSSSLSSHVEISTGSSLSAKSSSALMTPVRISTGAPLSAQRSSSLITPIRISTGASSSVQRSSALTTPVRMAISHVPSTPSPSFREPLVNEEDYGQPTVEDEQWVATVLGHHGSCFKFKTRHQFQHYKMLLERKYCVISVAPTGAGKTLPLLLAAHAWGPGIKMVIALPYVALYDEYIARFQCAGMVASVFSHNQEDSMMKKAQIILVSINHFCSKEFKTRLAQWSEDRVLGAIALDEAHGIVEDVGFRAEFHAMVPILLSQPNFLS